MNSGTGFNFPMLKPLTGMAAALGVAALATGCAAAVPDSSTWSGEIQLAPGKNLAFTVNMDFSTSTPNGYFEVGTERTAIPEMSRSGESLNLNFSEYGAEMRGAWDGGTWSGVYLRHRTTGTTSFPFSASPDRALPAGLPAELPVGTFQVRFEDEPADEADTVAKFWKEGTALHGTFIAPDGDYGLLEGKSQGGSLQLHRFTGWQATLIEIEPSGDEWKGTVFAASLDRPRPFVLQPRAADQVEARARPQPRMKNPDSPFAFACAAPTGETVHNSDERFKGKPMIVDIMGTWCHNCLDEAPVLQQLQNQYGKDGLEIVGLSFEIRNDAALARKNLKLFKDRFGLTYTLLFCGDLDDANVDRQLGSQIENFFAYPTALFIDRTGKVQTIHSGFKGPGAGDEFKAQVAEFQKLASRLVR
jgi:thiol-disulfide isomerase/thioredoxin